MTVTSSSVKNTEIPVITDCMDVSESTREDELRALLSAYLYPIALIITIGVGEWTTDSR